VGLTVGAATPYSEVLARVDGLAWQQYTPTASGAQAWALALPASGATTAGKHLLEIVVKSTTETQDRWNSQTTAVQFTGLTLSPGASVALPASRKYRVLVYGDSITEGVRVNGYSGIANDTDRNDNTEDYSYALGALLDAEVGVVGFGGTGMTVSGSGSVPALATSYNALWSGQPRSFSPVPDLVIYNEGTNDSGASLSAMQTAFATVVNGIGYAGTANTYAGLNGTRHLIMEPFNASQSANLPTVAAGFGSANVVYGSTAGLWSSSDSSDSLHPYAYSHLGQLAPGVAALAMPLLHPATTSLLANSYQARRGR
jgi:lysophospholipase L1-like esterase